MYTFTCTPSERMKSFFFEALKARAPKLQTPKLSTSYKPFLRAVRLTGILLLIGFLQVSAGTTAQQRFSISLRNAPLEKVFSEIEKKSGYTVFYNTDVLRASGMISIDVKDATIEDLLHQCLKGLPLEFTV